MIGLCPRVLGCVLTAAFGTALAETPLAVFPINQQSITQMRKDHPSASAEVNDPVYKRKQRYQGFWLRDLLKHSGQANHPEADLYVRFRCRDGYAPMMPLSRAMTGSGLIAIRDANAPPGEEWQRLPGTGNPGTPAPGYLVWVSPPGGPEEYPWPYQLVAIELVTPADALKGLDSDGSKPGGDLFVRHCLKCHAVNGIGGTLGPELNSPCSVTEYWNPRLLSRFIVNAGSIRTGTKMPSFTSLPEGDVQLIVDYLRSMASHKKAGASCP